MNATEAEPWNDGMSFWKSNVQTSLPFPKKIDGFDPPHP